MTAAEHRAAAAKERRLAMEEAAEARDELEPVDTPQGVEVGPSLDNWRFYDPSWDPGEPEHYTIDERIHVRGEDSARDARKHREKAARHERAARELEELRRVE